MARIRSLKVDFFTDEQLARTVSRDARLLYVGMWPLSDEWSRLRGSPQYLKGQLFAYDDDVDHDTIDGLVDELVTAKKAVRYVVNGETYLWLPNLHKHQRLEPERVPSKLPPPPDVAEPALFDAVAVQIRSHHGADGFALGGGGGGGQGTGVVGTRARTRTAVQGADEPPPSRTCPKHPDGTDKPCRGCQNAREARERYDAEVKADKARVAREHRIALGKARSGPVCMHGTPGGEQPHPTTGEPLCPLCRAEGN